MALKVDVVENFRGLLCWSLQLRWYFLDAQELVFIAEELKLVTKIAYLVIIESREGLKVIRPEYLIAHIWIN